MNNSNGSELLVLLALAAFAALIYYRKPWRPSSSAHGTASWAGENDLKRAGMLSGEGLLIGKTLGKVEKPIHHRRDVHLSIFAPTGAGKGVSLLIPWLLTWNRGSVLVLDPKGEL